MKKIREKSDGLGGLCSAIHVDAQRSTVVDIELDDATGSIYQIKKYTMRSIFRLVFLYKNEVIDRKALNNWWYGRSIPASRQGIQQALAALRVDSTQELLNKSYGLSLSDQYWIKEKRILFRMGRNQFL